MARALPLLILVTLSCASSLMFLLKVQSDVGGISLPKEEEQLHPPPQSRRLTEEASPPLPPILNHHQCKENAIVYLTQKRHSSYGRDSYSLFQKSLQLLHQNYLSKHSDNTAVFIFHEGDFDQPDLQFLESAVPNHANMHLVNLTGTHFWEIPEWLQKDDQETWVGIQKYSVGYRHMMRWYALKIWDFFHDLNQQQGCNYRYIMRLDEESYIHSPIEYDLFQSMNDHDYVYGFRQCSYEMSVVQGPFKQFMKQHDNKIPIHRDIRRGPLCGFYNNFFIASLDFMRSAHVQQFLKWIDEKGFMYRKRLNDLVLQTAVVYSFAPPEKIHRFLDFTYEHFTLTKDGCPFWGGMQAGYADPNGAKMVAEYSEQVIQRERKCKMFSEITDQGVRINEVIGEADLSPTYQHLPPHIQGNLQLLQIAAGNVDKANHGVRSGR